MLVAQAPDLMFLKDTDGDDKADVRERVLHGLDYGRHASHRQQLRARSRRRALLPGRTFHHTQVETPWGPPVRNVNAGVYRYEPRTQKFEAYVSFGFANPHGHVFDRWGQDIVVDGTGARAVSRRAVLRPRRLPAKAPEPPQVYQQRTRPCPGIGDALAAGIFPNRMQGNLLVPTSSASRASCATRSTTRAPASPAAEQEPIVSSSDPNFRPADLKIGPDGAIYFTDWHNPIIGHMQHNLRDPNRDRTHGRIYRVTYEGRPLLKPAKIAGEPIEKLLDLLKEPEDRVRYRARIELTRPQDRAKSSPRSSKWLAGARQERPAITSTTCSKRCGCIRTHNVVEHRTARIACCARPTSVPGPPATRVLCYWRDRVPDALDCSRSWRPTSIRACGSKRCGPRASSRVPEAVEIPLIAAEHPTRLVSRFRPRRDDEDARSVL